MKKFGMFHTLKCLQKKTQIFIKPLQYVKRIEIFQKSKAQKLAEKTQSFLSNQFILENELK